MKKIAYALAFAALLSSPALAAEPAPADPVNKSAQPDPANKPAAIPLLAGVVANGEEVTPGDVISMSRTYLGGWSLKCDLRLSRDQRVCLLEQVVRDGDRLALWRVAQSAEGKPTVIVSMPADFDPNSGLTLSFSGLDKTISADEWRCGPTGCIAAFPFAGVLASAVSSSDHVKFSYKIKAGDGQATAVSLVAPMSGFGQVLEASKDPFGKPVAPKSDPKAEKVKADDKPQKAKAKPADPKPREEKKPSLY